MSTLPPSLHPTINNSSNKRGRDVSDPSVFESPSPKKPPTNFTQPISDDNTVVSNDDEGRWELKRSE